MATKIAACVFRRTLRNSQHQRRVRNTHFHRWWTNPGCYLSFSSFSSSSSPPHILIENLYRKTNSDSDSDSNDNGGDDNDESSCMITKITLNRPKANAMGRQMISELRACLDTLEAVDTTTPIGSAGNHQHLDGNSSSSSSSSNSSNNNITPASLSRCVVLASCSDRVFSAGADLKERSTMTEEETENFVALLRDTFERVASLPMPVIAALEGVALGGGLELALAADLRIASGRALLGFPETSLAILPGAGGTQRLPKLVGASKAKELIWTGRKIKGREALRCGLVNEVVNLPGGNGGGGATERAIDLAFSIAAQGPIAIRASKAAIEQGGELGAPMREALEIEKGCYSRVVPTRDRLEGLRAFKEGRTPIYKGE